MLTEKELQEIEERLNAAPIEFIFHARQDIPNLLNYIEELRAVVQAVYFGHGLLQCEEMSQEDFDEVVENLAALIGEDAE